MATVAILFGIIIGIHPADHNPPHVHVWYNGEQAVFLIQNGNIRGKCKIPKSKTKLVKDFILCYQDELLKMWDSKQYYLIKKA